MSDTSIKLFKIKLLALPISANIYSPAVELGKNKKNMFQFSICFCLVLFFHFWFFLVYMHVNHVNDITTLSRFPYTQSNFFFVFGFCFSFHLNTKIHIHTFLRIKSISFCLSIPYLVSWLVWFGLFLFVLCFGFFLFSFN